MNAVADPASEPGVVTLTDALQSLHCGAMTPATLTEACLKRIELHEPRLHAFTVLDAKQARTDAARILPRSQQQNARQNPRQNPPQNARPVAADPLQDALAGIPIGIKDVIDVAGLPTRAQSRQLLEQAPAAIDAPAVAALRAAGAVIFGKLTTHEFSFGIPDWDAPWPPARNPWQTDRFAGGSSSGAAVATASGMVLGALGSDTAGSVRSPAALCGVSGFKPSARRLPRAGCVPLAPSLDALGVLAPGVADCAVLYDVLSAAQASGGAAPVRLSEAADSIEGIRIGVVRHFFSSDLPVSEECGAAIDAAIDVFERLGCQVRDVRLPPLMDWHDAGVVILLSEAYAYHEAWLRTREERYGRSFSDAVLLGATLSAADYLAAIERRGALRRAFDTTMQEVDLLLCAIQGGEAPRFEALSPWGFLERPSYGMPFNLSDSPALSLCSGFGPAGLPLAMQLVGPDGGEAAVLQAGFAYENATRWCAPAKLQAAMKNALSPATG
jgi:aspartyl-tRNA(Asn)/glutamyl-tRNA(Gln) amidotransferase subunit A